MVKDGGWGGKELITGQETEKMYDRTRQTDSENEGWVFGAGKNWRDLKFHSG